MFAGKEDSPVANLLLATGGKDNLIKLWTFCAQVGSAGMKWSSRWKINTPEAQEMNKLWNEESNTHEPEKKKKRNEYLEPEKINKP